MSFDLDDWYRDFLTWMRAERGQEALEIQSDCSSELYLNALVALHLRRYGRSRGFPLWWARSEWAKVDISFGRATKRFTDWNIAWNEGKTGDIGQIEGKVLYRHYNKATRDHKLAELKRQLDDRRKADKGYREGQLYLGLVWMVSFEPPGPDNASLRASHASPDEWAESFTKHDLVIRDPPVERPESPIFDHVATLDMEPVWPCIEVGSGSLWVTLVEPAGK